MARRVKLLALSSGCGGGGGAFAVRLGLANKCDCLPRRLDVLVVRLFVVSSVCCSVRLFFCEANVFDVVLFCEF